MADSSIASSPEATWFGVKLGFAVAGFWGGVISLSFIKNLTARQGVMAVLTGIASANYGTPLAAFYLIGNEANAGKEYAIAFVIGLTAMNLIPGIVKLSEIWQRNPLAVIRGKNDGSVDE